MLARTLRTPQQPGLRIANHLLRALHNTAFRLGAALAKARLHLLQGLPQFRIHGDTRLAPLKQHGRRTGFSESSLASTSRAPIPGSAALSGRPGAGRATSSNCAVPACWLYSTRDLSCDVPSDIDATPRSRNRSTRGADDPDVRGVRDGPHHE